MFQSIKRDIHWILNLEHTSNLTSKKGSNIRDLVFGFGDGVNTSLGIVSGVGGAAVAADIVILGVNWNVYRC